jgi:outer membrane protein
MDAERVRAEGWISKLRAESIACTRGVPMRFLTAVAMLALIAPAAVSANELLRVYDLALQNDTTLRAAAGQRLAGTAGAPQAFGALLPQVSGFGSYTDSSGESTNTYTDPPFAIDNNGMPVSSDSTQTTLRLSLRQSLFDAAAWNRWQQADASAAAAEATYRLAEQALVVRVAEAYFALLGTADNLRFADAEKKAVERSLELAKKRFEVGLSAITDVQEAQARYDLTVAQMIEAEQALTSAKLALDEITGASTAPVVPLREEIPLLGPTPDDVNEWVKIASTNSFELRLARAQADAAKQGVDAAWAAHLPTVAFVGAQTVTEGDRTGGEFGPVESEADNLSVGLELNVPIFAGGSTQAGVNAAKGTLQQRRAELEGRQRSVERATRNTYQGVIAGVSRVKALKQAVLSNNTALEASEVGLEVGARTAVDVLNAQRELYRAQRDYARSRYDYLLNILRLKQSAGQLTRKDLAEIDALLGTEAPPVQEAPPAG